jgi:hypothetical protein
MGRVEASDVPQGLLVFLAVIFGSRKRRPGAMRMEPDEIDSAADEHGDFDSYYRGFLGGWLFAQRSSV